eukprot:TRINITY_DN4220_c0_g1_i1.p1 TRINITY_DN4220_c0_g1~~TRINITY_DN4220_c0_g1_i1.p1  ORF type:complete len:730 (+),score=176.12 TRINITY_DN4220_c0_g1_i1:68-2257(+)
MPRTRKHIKPPPDQSKDLKYAKALKDRAAALAVLQLVLKDKDGSTMRAWLRHFDYNYDKQISYNEFMAGMQRIGYQGYPDDLFRRIDVDKNDELTLEEIDPGASKVWMKFRIWCSKMFTDAEDMIQQLNNTSAGDLQQNVLGRDAFCKGLQRLGWDGGDEIEIFDCLDVIDEQAITVANLNWLTVDRKKQQRKEKILQEALQKKIYQAKEKQEIARQMKSFRTFLKKRFSSMCRACRSLDMDGSMFVQKHELFKAAREWCWQGDVRLLWKGLDKDNSGITSIQEIDSQSAEQLAKFKQQCTDKFGSAVETFRALDVLKLGKLRAPQFIEGCQVHGFTKVNKALFLGLDFRNNKYITEQDVQFLDTWRCPSYLTAKPSDETAKQFKAALLRIYPSYLKAWRLLLDRDGSNAVGWEEFESAAKRIHFKGDVAGAWRSFDADISGTISLREIDAPTWQVLADFKTWADEEFGSVKAAFKVLDQDNSGDFTPREWRKALSSYGFQGDSKSLFTAFDTDGEGLVSLDEIAFLDEWESAEEPELEETAVSDSKPKKTAVKVSLTPRLQQLATVKPKPALPVIQSKPSQEIDVECPGLKTFLLHSTYGQFPSKSRWRRHRNNDDVAFSSTVSVFPAIPDTSSARQQRVQAIKREILIDGEITYDADYFGSDSDDDNGLARIKDKTISLRNRTVELFGKDEICGQMIPIQSQVKTAKSLLPEKASPLPLYRLRYLNS